MCLKRTGRKKPAPPIAINASTGSTLIEVLVCILLISLGLLGAAGMQARAIGHAADTTQRQAAAVLADELLEIMRADPASVLDAAGKPRTGSGYLFGPGMDDTQKTARLPKANTSCQPFPMDADSRLTCWFKRVQEVIPAVENTLLKEQFRVQADAATSIWTIQIAWPVEAGQCLQANAAKTGITDDEFCTYTVQSIL